VKGDCEAFYVGDVTGGKLYHAIMEGVGFAERFAFDHMQDLGCEVGDVIYTTGGACRSDLWLRIRASILNRQLKVPSVVDMTMPVSSNRSTSSTPDTIKCSLPLSSTRCTAADRSVYSFMFRTPCPQDMGAISEICLLSGRSPDTA
jgi:hypothetical protein